MKKYLKNLIWKPIAIFVSVLAVVCCIIMPVKYAAIITILAIICCGCYFLINRNCQKLFRATGPGSYFQDLGWRNVEAIVVGSTLSWRYIDFKKIPYYNATGFKRSNEMNFNMLKTYYSHVREGGTVYYIVDPLESKAIGDYISPCDFQHIHPHVFLKLGVSYPVINQINPLVFDRRYSIEFFCTYILKKFGVGNSWSSKDSVTLDESYANKLGQDLQGIMVFCQDRNLKCKFVFLGKKKINMASFKSVLSKYIDKNDYFTADNIEELYKVFQN